MLEIPPAEPAVTMVGTSMVTDSKKSDTIMERRPDLSSPHYKSLFNNMVIVLIIIAVVIIGVLFGILFQQKIETAKALSKQQTNSAALPLNGRNAVAPAILLNTESTGSTNILAPVPPPEISATNPG